MRDESQEAKIARIDTNVQHLIKVFDVVPSLVTDSEINKREHRFAIWAVCLVATPFVLYACKKLGVPLF